MAKVELSDSAKEMPAKEVRATWDAERKRQIERKRSIIIKVKRIILVSKIEIRL